MLSGDFGETNIADKSIPETDHERIAKCLINALFQQTLFNRPEYGGYLEGMILPPSLRHLEIHLQHGARSRTVVDNFGDLDEQEFHAAEALDKTENTLDLAVVGAGNSLTIWEDVEHEAISAPTPHHTKGVELAWEPPQMPNALYTTDTESLPAARDDVISLRIGQYFEDVQLNPENLPADIFVTLEDGNNFATVRAGAVSMIPYPDLQEGASGLCPMRTIRIPVDAFTAANPSFDRTNISQISLDLTARPTGHLLADDIEISM